MNELETLAQTAVQAAATYQTALRAEQGAVAIREDLHTRVRDFKPWAETSLEDLATKWEWAKRDVHKAKAHTGQCLRELIDAANKLHVNLLNTEEK